MLNIVGILVSVVRVEIEFHLVIFAITTGYTLVEIYEKHRTWI